MPPLSAHTVRFGPFQLDLAGGATVWPRIVTTDSSEIREIYFRGIEHRTAYFEDPSLVGGALSFCSESTLKSM